MNYCVIFSRVSTESQDLIQQTESIKKEAERLGYDDKHQILIEFKESAISKTTEEREGITELKEAINNNPKIDCVICWELSRIARRADVIYNIRDFFLEHKIQFIVMTPYMQLLDADGKMSQSASIMLALFTSLAESEMAIKKERLKRGMNARIAQGFYTGGPILYGYTVDKQKRYIPDEESTAPMVRKIYALYSTGEYSFRKLGLEIKDLGGFKTVTEFRLIGKVHEILNDTRYYGSNPFYPAIISKELYDKCKVVMKENLTVQKTANKHQMLGKRLLKTKENDRYMGCVPAHLLYTAFVLDKYRLSVRQKHVDPVIWETALWLHKKYITNKEVRQKKLLEELRQIDIKCKNSIKEVTEIQKKIDRLEERYIMGNISNEKVNAMSIKLRKNLKEAKEKVQRYNDAACQKGQQMYDDYWEVDNGGYDNLSFEEKRKIVLQCINKIYVTRPVYNKRLVFLEIHSNFNKVLYRTIDTDSYRKHKPVIIDKE